MGDPDKNKVEAFEGLLAYLDVPGVKKASNKRFRQILEKRDKHYPAKKIKKLIEKRIEML